MAGLPHFLPRARRSARGSGGSESRPDARNAISSRRSPARVANLKSFELFMISPFVSGYSARNRGMRVSSEPHRLIPGSRSPPPGPRAGRADTAAEGLHHSPASGRPWLQWACVDVNGSAKPGHAKQITTRTRPQGRPCRDAETLCGLSGLSGSSPSAIINDPATARQSAVDFPCR